MFDPTKRQKDQDRAKKSEEVKEDKHLIKLASIHPHKGHRIFKVIQGQLHEVEDSDYIERRVTLHCIRKDGTFSYSASIKMKAGMYITALNKKNAQKTFK